MQYNSLETTQSENSTNPEKAEQTRSLPTTIPAESTKPTTDTLGAPPTAEIELSDAKDPKLTPQDFIKKIVTCKKLINRLPNDLTSASETLLEEFLAEICTMLDGLNRASVAQNLSCLKQLLHIELSFAEALFKRSLVKHTSCMDCLNFFKATLDQCIERSSNQNIYALKSMVVSILKAEEYYRISRGFGTTLTDTPDTPYTIKTMLLTILEAYKKALSTKGITNSEKLSDRELEKQRINGIFKKDSKTQEVVFDLHTYLRAVDIPQSFASDAKSITMRLEENISKTMAAIRYEIDDVNLKRLIYWDTVSSFLLFFVRHQQRKMDPIASINNKIASFSLCTHDFKPTSIPIYLPWNKEKSWSNEAASPFRVHFFTHELFLRSWKADYLYFTGDFTQSKEAWTELKDRIESLLPSLISNEALKKDPILLSELLKTVSTLTANYITQMALIDYFEGLTILPEKKSQLPTSLSSDKSPATTSAPITPLPITISAQTSKTALLSDASESKQAPWAKDFYKQKAEEPSKKKSKKKKKHTFDKYKKRIPDANSSYPTAIEPPALTLPIAPSRQLNNLNRKKKSLEDKTPRASKPISLKVLSSSSPISASATKNRSRTNEPGISSGEPGATTAPTENKIIKYDWKNFPPLGKQEKKHAKAEDPHQNYPARSQTTAPMLTPKKHSLSELTTAVSPTTSIPTHFASSSASFLLPTSKSVSTSLEEKKSRFPRSPRAPQIPETPAISSTQDSALETVLPMTFESLPHAPQPLSFALQATPPEPILPNPFAAPAPPAPGTSNFALPVSRAELKMSLEELKLNRALRKIEARERRMADDIRRLERYTSQLQTQMNANLLSPSTRIPTFSRPTPSSRINLAPPHYTPPFQTNSTYVRSTYVRGFKPAPAYSGSRAKSSTQLNENYFNGQIASLKERSSFERFTPSLAMSENQANRFHGLCLARKVNRNLEAIVVKKELSFAEHTLENGKSIKRLAQALSTPKLHAPMVNLNSPSTGRTFLTILADNLKKHDEKSYLRSLVQLDFSKCILLSADDEICIDQFEKLLQNNRLLVVLELPVSFTASLEKHHYKTKIQDKLAKNKENFVNLVKYLIETNNNDELELISENPKLVKILSSHSRELETHAEEYKHITCFNSLAKALNPSKGGEQPPQPPAHVASSSSSSSSFFHHTAPALPPSFRTSKPTEEIEKEKPSELSVTLPIKNIGKGSWR